jgi:hypothetical protein
MPMYVPEETVPPMYPPRKAILYVVDEATGKTYPIKVTLADNTAMIPVSVEKDDVLSEKLRSELASTRVIVNYGYGYRVFPFINYRGEAVFAVSQDPNVLPAGKPLMCKVFMLEGFSEPVEIGDLYALDSRAVATGQPFITIEGSILVPTQNNPDLTQVAIWRYDGKSWSKVYEDMGVNMVAVAHFTQDPVTRAIYGGYRNNVNSIVLKSTDDGKSWSKVYVGTETDPSLAYIYTIAAYNDYVIVPKRDKCTIVRSTDGGATWTESSVLPSALRCATIMNDLGLSFITSDNYIYYSRDYFASYKRIRVQSGAGSWILRYPLRVGGRLLLCGYDGSRTVIFASRDLYHTVTPIFTSERFLGRIAAYGDYLLLGCDTEGVLVRVQLLKTLEKGLSCPILLWENQSITDTTNGLTTDYVEAEYNERKTFYIISDQSGTLYIQAYDEVAGAYADIDSTPVSANTLTPYSTTYGARLMCLRFVPSASATASAWAVLE